MYLNLLPQCVAKKVPQRPMTTHPIGDNVWLMWQMYSRYTAKIKLTNVQTSIKLFFYCLWLFCVHGLDYVPCIVYNMFYCEFCRWMQNPNITIKNTLDNVSQFVAVCWMKNLINGKFTLSAFTENTINYCHLFVCSTQNEKYWS